MAADKQAVRSIRIDEITVPNPRSRNQRVFEEIVQSISSVGLKRPITVTRRGRKYELVCGQGRLEAFQALGQTEIPALVVDANDSECMVMGLVENVARRRHTPLEMLSNISLLRSRGYDLAQVAQKTGLSVDYVRDICQLLEKGEQRLLNGVESGTVPLSVAAEIAAASDADIQDVLQRAYEADLLKGRKLIAARRLLESRRRKGKGSSSQTRGGHRLTVEHLVRTYEDDAGKKRRVIKEVRDAVEQLALVAHIVRSLFEDADFKTLLVTEGLSTVPASLAQKVEGT